MKDFPNPKYPMMSRIFLINRKLEKWYTYGVDQPTPYTWRIVKMHPKPVMCIGYRTLNEGYTKYLHTGETRFYLTKTLPALLVTDHPRKKGFYIPMEGYYVQP